MDYIKSGSQEAVFNALSMRLARQCRHIIQVCLREDEWIDADREFTRIIRAGLDELSGDQRYELPPVEE